MCNCTTHDETTIFNIPKILYFNRTAPQAFMIYAYVETFVYYLCIAKLYLLVLDFKKRSGN